MDRIDVVTQQHEEVHDTEMSGSDRVIWYYHGFFSHLRYEHINLLLICVELGAQSTIIIRTTQKTESPTETEQPRGTWTNNNNNLYFVLSVHT